MEKAPPILIRLSCVLFFSPPSETNQFYTFSTIIKVSGGKIYLIYIPYKCQGTEVLTHFNI